MSTSSMDMDRIDINNLARVHWACRRGMRELDVLIMPFFEEEYGCLSMSDKHSFVALLEHQDPQLFRWLMNQSVPEEQNLARMVKLIQMRNQQRGPSTL